MAFTPEFRGPGQSGPGPGTYPAQGATGTAVVDAGLRAYLLRVFNWMVSGLLVTGIVSYGIAHTSLLQAFYQVGVDEAGRSVIHQTPLAMIAMFAPLAFVLVLSFGVNRLSTTTAQALYWAFCAAMGASLTTIFISYTGDSIARVFFITAGTFAAVSAYGYTTKADLTKLGSFLMMGLFGIVLASVVNIFLGSSGMQFIISLLGVVIFTGLTAYDTQRIKADYVQYAYGSGTDLAAKRSVYDALNLYLNFINLFMMLLRLMGNNRN